ncbi:MAG: 16S rRNA (adenine(1518)-N(6)/adenine(1519)-N(6))-dimethyltransferase RsmA [Candidatus Aminicenantes bacterium]|nr:16S rRNA (adenine(1518)-N(6)/adenine(1519)-N(6))-dimethyltransferase RsmA [Candidatus Aminicenantes bacterium]
MKKSRRHALGQHFLASRGILDRIAAAAAPIPGETILEIGSGKGALTLSLLASGARIVAVEKDPVLAQGLKADAHEGLTVIEGDILDVDWAELMKAQGAGDGPYLVTGNLPYSISSPILFRLLDQRLFFRKAVFLVQKEVAERFIAGPGGKDYAPLGILLQIYFAVKILFKVAPGSFVPPPRVDSAVVSLERREAPLVEVGDFDRFRRFVNACFAQRRKTLSNNLAAAGYPHDGVFAALDSLGLDHRVRAEQIPVASLLEISRLLASPYTGRPNPLQ